MEKSERYKKGFAVFKKHIGEDAKKYVTKLETIYPKFGRINMEFPFGDLYSDEHILDAKTREIATVAALTVLGYAIPQLKLHVKCAIHCGATKEEILEIITQMLAYSGFPSATNALIAADEVFQELKI